MKHEFFITLIVKYPIVHTSNYLANLTNQILMPEKTWKYL